MYGELWKDQLGLSVMDEALYVEAGATIKTPCVEVSTRWLDGIRLIERRGGCEGEDSKVSPL